MEEIDGFNLTPTGDMRPVKHYLNFLVEAKKQGFSFILPLEDTQKDWICEIYHLTLPIERAFFIDCTFLNTDLCDIILTYTNWPWLWEALFAKVSGVLASNSRM
jgi:hypothetical protein